MSEPNETMVTESNHYEETILANETKQEYEETKAKYKAARRTCKTNDERKTLMRMYMDDIIELAVQSRIAGDMDFNANLNQEVRALRRRIFTGQNNSW